MKHLQTLLIIFCLGIFLIPKDNFYAQASQESCCKTSSSSSCCEKNSNKDHHSNDSGKSNKSCTDDCCSFCMTCHTFIQNSFAKKSFWNFHFIEKAEKNYAQYTNPYVSNSLKKIWQPPKLA
ncbi:hypothetical protein [Chryseobacterium sp. Leaf180]|uniref:hypothetical protein n=1 Tax=Chryseobacterium sp. Leaf180 TaxID=1736289 RepID=UPI001EE69B72|nr:hypothetical protein [Chryseobacterium sp. Leaf180]